MLPCIIYLGASEGYLLVYVSISMFRPQSICTNSIVSFPTSILVLKSSEVANLLLQHKF